VFGEGLVGQAGLLDVPSGEGVGVEGAFEGDDGGRSARAERLTAFVGDVEVAVEAAIDTAKSTRHVFHRKNRNLDQIFQSM
jgi:hypothetical protein